MIGGVLSERTEGDRQDHAPEVLRMPPGDQGPRLRLYEVHAIAGEAMATPILVTGAAGSHRSRKGAICGSSR